MQIENLIPHPLDHEKLEHVCEELFGEDWKEFLVTNLKVTRRTVNLWKSGKIKVPAGVIFALNLVKSGRIKNV